DPPTISTLSLTTLFRSDGDARRIQDALDGGHLIEADAAALNQRDSKAHALILEIGDQTLGQRRRIAVSAKIARETATGLECLARSEEHTSELQSRENLV